MTGNASTARPSRRLTVTEIRSETNEEQLGVFPWRRSKRGSLLPSVTHSLSDSVCYRICGVIDIADDDNEKSPKRCRLAHTDIALGDDAFDDITGDCDYGTCFWGLCGKKFIRWYTML